MIITELRNCFGINGTDSKSTSQGLKDYCFDLYGKKQKAITHLVYGVNRTGKTSFTKVMKKLQKKEIIQNLFEHDLDPSVNINLFGYDFIYKEGEWQSHTDISSRLLICDKHFVSSNIDVVNRTVELGFGIKRLNETSATMNESKVLDTDINQAIKQLSGVNRQSDVNGVFQQMGGKDLFGRGGKAFSALYNQYLANVGLAGIDVDLMERYKPLLNYPRVPVENILKHMDTLCKTVSSVLHRYNILSPEDFSFYSMAKDYISSKEPSRCPLCLKAFDVDELQKIIVEVEEALHAYAQDEAKKDVHAVYDSLQQMSGERVQCMLTYLDRLMSGDIDQDMIDDLYKCINDFKYFYSHCKQFVYGTLINQYRTELDMYTSNKKEYEKALAESRKFPAKQWMPKFQELLLDSSLDFPDYAKPVLNEDKNAIELEITGSVSPIKFETYHQTHASEGEKSVLSLLFFFSIVYAQSESNNQDMLMIFDDPVDSHDNYNKKLIVHFLHKQLQKLSVPAIILSHSCDFIRDNLLGYGGNVELHLMSNEAENLIVPIEKKHHCLFQGVVPFFKSAVTGKHTSETNSVFTAIAMLPILREILDDSRILSDDMIDKSELDELYRLLSNGALHYSLDDSLAITTSQLIEIYRSTIPGFRHTKKGEETLKTMPGETVYQFVERRSKRDEYGVPNLTENIKYKNICAMRLRYLIEEVLFDFGTSFLSEKQRGSFEDDYKSRYRVQDKIKLVQKYIGKYGKHKSEIEQVWSTIKETIYKYKAVANDFHHMINAYITPMIELSVAKIRYMIADVERLKSLY
jgi:hypothetical protein